MKKILLSLSTLFLVFFATAQSNILGIAKANELLENNKQALKLSSTDIQDAAIISTYENKFASTTMVYLQQTHQNVPVYNQIQTIAFKNGKVVSQSGTFLNNIDNIANVKSEVPSISANAALLAAIADRKLVTKQSATIISNENGRKITFSNMGVASENITATLMWFPTDEGKKSVKLGWQIYIVQKNSADYWLVNIDATNKNTLSVGNLTVYCSFDAQNKNAGVKHNHSQNCHSTLLNNKIVENKISKNNTSPSAATIVNTATYRVVPFPAESPLHPGGAPALVTNPWELSPAGSNATTLKWHSVGVTNYDITRGNNVWAQEDRDGSNATPGVPVVSATTPDPLNFDFVPDFTVVPTQTTPVPNQQFNTTNLFYWNNIIHDLTYQYGFDEAARNFQGDNQGRGGNGGDFVLADAQDGIGTNNANFSTPPDGGSGRMQMFLWTAPNPDRDGDVDNGIIVHEYGHGISNRLTGNGSSCLQNAEQQGEGWSDYYSLMYTQNWATSNLNTGFDSPRGIGTYANNQTPGGGGIRSQRYCTDFSVNNRVYATTIPGAGGQHSRGEIWCATLWDMTWGIINQVGSINPNIFNANGAGGNSIALKLVTEGMKLQPCSPGFISSRDAILQADLILYGGAYRCTIIEAFRRRGMGLGASEGSTGSTTDQVPSFTNGGSLKLLQSTTSSVAEGQNIVYRNRFTTDPCAGVTGFTITDTIPLNVTYLSGGTYNAANRVVSFTVNQTAGTTVDYNFTVSINSGTYFAPVTLLNEPVPATMPATWTPVTTLPAGGLLWNVSTIQTNSTPNAFFSENEVISTDKRLELTTPLPLAANASSYPKLSFAHRFNTEGDWDGGVVEVSTNGGTTWTDLGNNFIVNPYNGSLGAGAGNNLANRAAFTGLVTTFINSTIKLLPYVGQSAKIRFRFASDDNTAGTGTPTGWFVDDVKIADTASVSMRASLFNASTVRIALADTVTQIAQALAAPPTITSQPTSTTVCAGATAVFNVTASGGVSNTFNWEVSTNAGVNWASTVPAANTTTLTLLNVNVSMNGYLYRLVVSNSSGSATSGAATLTVNAAPNAPTVVSPVNYCVNQTPTPLNATGINLLWYATATSTSGSSTAPLVATSTASSTTYFVSQSATVGGCESPRASILVNVNATPIAPTVTTPITYCLNATATALTATGSNLKWYTVATAGTSSATAPIPSTNTIGSINYYVSQTSGICEGPRITITVNTTAITAAPTAASPVNYCQGSTANALTATGTNLLWYNQAIGGTSSATAPTPTTTAVGTTTYYVTQTGLCESARTAIIVNVAATPNAPIVTSPLSYCQGSIAPILTAAGTNILWYTNATSGIGSAIAPIPATNTVGSITYYVSQSIGTCEGARSGIIVNVTAAPIIIMQPTDITSCSTSATFTIAASGTSLTYQWYVSTDAGTTFTAINGATSNILTLTGLSAAQSNYRYRAVVSSGACTPAISNSVFAKVGITPVVVLTAAPTVNFNPYTNGGLYSTISPTGNYNYVWKRNNTSILNTTPSLTRANGLLEDFGSYTVTVTDINTGCVGSSNSVSVNDIEAGRATLFVWPNPTTGIVRVSYYSNANTVLKNTLQVFDEKGALVMSTQLTFTSGRYGNATVNLTALTKGTYLFVLVDAGGKQLTTEKIIKY